MIMSSVLEKLNKVQVELKAPKGQFNKFGNYKYRSCEDILEGVKPLLEKVEAVITLNDDVQVVGDRFYIKATAKFIDTRTSEFVEVNAFAREENMKKGMDSSQVSGSSSSYARKYALNGLLLIDDTKDADSNEQKEVETKVEQAPSQEKEPTEEEIKEVRKLLYAKEKDVIDVPTKQPWELVKENQVDWLIKENNLNTKEEITMEMVNALKKMLNEARKGKR